MQPQGSCRRRREGGEGRTRQFRAEVQSCGLFRQMRLPRPRPFPVRVDLSFKSPTIICRPSVIFFRFSPIMDSEQSRTKKTGRRLIISLVRLVTVSRKRFCKGRRLPGKAAPSCIRAPAVFLVEEVGGYLFGIDPRACATGRNAGRNPFKETCKSG